MPARYRELGRDPRSPLVQRFAQAGLRLADRAWIPSPLRAHEAAAWAREQGRFEPFHQSLLKRYWEGGEDISAWEVLRAAALDAGLDPDALQQAVEAGTYRARVQEAADEARDLGVTGIPTFLLDDRYAVVGAQPYEVLEKIAQRLGVPRRASGGP